MDQVRHVTLRMTGAEQDFQFVTAQPRPVDAVVIGDMMQDGNFWNTHTIWFILAMFFFPRLTMLFATTFGGGFWYWLGWFFAPRLTVAIIATMLYGQSNTFLVVLTWLWALSGESTEKSTAGRFQSR